MFGCCRLAALRASSRKRADISGIEASIRLRNFTATRLPRAGCSASSTAPMPPWPRTDDRTKLPTRFPMSSRNSGGTSAGAFGSLRS